MPPPIRKYDALGFPVPATFDDLSMPDRDAATKPAPTRLGGGVRGASRRKRIVLGALLAAIVALATIPWLKNVGQELLGDWMAERARQKFRAGDMPGTVADSTRAFSFLGDELEDEKHAELLWLRGVAKLELNDLVGSVADFDRVLTSPKSSRDTRARCYFRRAWAYCRLKKFSDATSDATAVIELAGANHPGLPLLLNQRAYIRALANSDKQDRQELQAGLKDVEQAIAVTPDHPAYIDTRGYLLHLLERNDEALREMNRAIEITFSMKQQAYLPDDPRRLKENLAVMFYHRGLIHRALEMSDKALEDFQMADEYGYDPEAGVL